MKHQGGSGHRFGVAGPCSPRLFARDLGRAPGDLPKGMGGTPVNHLVRSLLDAGNAVTLATLDHQHRGPALAVFEGKRLTLAVGPYRPRGRARDWFRLERRAITTGLMANAPNAISAHWSYEFALGAVATGAPTLVTVRDVPSEVFRLQPTPYRLIRWFMHRRALKLATSVAFNSPYTRAALNQPRRTNSLILPNTIPDDAWVLPPREPPNPAAPRFISVNNGFGKLKNVMALLEAFARVVGHLPAASLTLVGDGFGEAGTAQSWAWKHGFTRGVRFLGPRDHADVLSLIQGADVLVHPSLEESFGYTLIEAASVGTPVVGGQDSGAVPWVLEGGASGVLTDVTDPQAIATAMESLIGSPDDWRRIRARASDVGKSRFSASAVTKDYVGELERIAR